MGKLFQMNDDLYAAHNPFVAGNTFLGATPEDAPLPTYEEARDRLPEPIWAGHEATLRCYDKAWALAFGNLRRPTPGTGFVSNFIDTAFNGYLFLWDSSLIALFGLYGDRVFSFQRTLDNFYSHQHRDGFICREICESAPGAQFNRDDPASTGPNILAWSEWEYYRVTGKKERLARVFSPLRAYHEWLRLNRSWPDGSYWSCGLGCGLDNLPRTPAGYDVEVSHGFMSWIDACAQTALDCDCLIRMAEELGRADEIAALREEKEHLTRIVNDTMWDDEIGFYFDKLRDGTLNRVKTVASFWTLAAGLATPERAARMAAHLDDEREFKRPVPIPSLSADHPAYRPDGGYWRGGVWASANTMILHGLRRYGFDAQAHRIACAYLAAVVTAFEETGTLWENYAPERPVPGDPAKPDFVGWTGLAPITLLFEYVFGLHPEASENRLTWDIRLTEEHGVRRYPLGDATLTLHCAARADEKEKPAVTICSDRPLTVELRWAGGCEVRQAEPAK